MHLQLIFWQALFCDVLCTYVKNDDTFTYEQACEIAKSLYLVHTCTEWGIQIYYYLYTVGWKNF